MFLVFKKRLSWGIFLIVTPRTPSVSSLSPATSAHHSDVRSGQQSTVPLQECSWKTSCAICGQCLSFLGPSRGPENPSPDHEPFSPHLLRGLPCESRSGRGTVSEACRVRPMASLCTVLTFIPDPHIVFTSSLQGLWSSGPFNVCRNLWGQSAQHHCCPLPTVLPVWFQPTVFAKW